MAVFCLIQVESRAVFDALYLMRYICCAAFDAPHLTGYI